MQIKNLSPYITLNGTAAEAIALYERVLGAEQISVTRASDVPGTSEKEKNRIYHSVLRLAGTQLMVSDAAGGAQKGGSNVHVALDFTDLSDMSRRFAALSEQGKVTLPLQDTFWGAKFGMLIDRFGVQWMFNWAGAQQA